MTKATDLVGQTFGLLTVRERAGTTIRGEALWRCSCSCGAEKVARGTLLRAGQTKSCGCLVGRDEASKARRKREAQAKRDRARRSWVGRGLHVYELRQDGVPESALQWATRAWT